MNQAHWYRLSKADRSFFDKKLIYRVRAVASAKTSYLYFAFKKYYPAVLWYESRSKLRCEI